MARLVMPRWALVLLLWVAGMTAAAQFAKMGVFLPELEAYYPDAGPGFGFVVSILSLIGAVFGLFAGIIVAGAGFRKVLLGAMTLGVLMSLYQASLPPFPLMLVSRTLEGASHLGVVVAAPTLIAQISEGRFQGAAMALFSTFFGVAFALMALFGAPFVGAYGLPVLFVAHAGVMAVLLAVLFLVLPRDAELDVDRPRLSLASIARHYGEVFRSPFMNAPAIGWLFYTLIYVSLASILPNTLPPESRVWAATFIPLAGIATGLTLAVVLLRYFKAVTVLLLGFGTAMMMALVMVLFPGNALLCVALFLCLGLVQTGSFAAIPQLNAEASHRAYANGAMAQAGNIGNLLGTPLLLALLGATGFSGMMAAVALIFAAAIVAHLMLGRQRRRMI